MNKQEFEAMANSWYQRTHSLREYFLDQSKSKIKRAKAWNLFIEMYGRIMMLTEIYIEMTMPPPKEFKNGSIPAYAREHK